MTDIESGLSVLKDMDRSNGDARDLSQNQISLLRRTFEDKKLGLFLFAKYIFGYKDLTYDLHLGISRFLGRWGDTELDTGEIITRPPIEGDNFDLTHRRLMVCIPREMF